MRLEEYFIIDRYNPRGMLLYSLPDPNDDDSWTLGQRFVCEPGLPIVIEIVTGYEKYELLPYFGAQPLISDTLYKVLSEAGVKNLDVYDAIIRGEDGAIEYTGYKAFNLIGLIGAADMERSRFSENNASRFIDASIESLTIDPNRTGGLLMFRLAEFSGAVVVHRRIKEAIEASGLPFIRFYKPEDYMS